MQNETFLVCYIGRYDISSQQIRQIQASIITEKLVVISMLRLAAEKKLLSYKDANNNY